MNKLRLTVVTATLLSGCGVIPSNIFGREERPEPVIEQAPAEEPGGIPDNARTEEEFDTTSAEDRAAALDAAAGSSAESNLGLTIASLGDVTQTGIWLKTPLVSEVSQGRVEVVDTGKAVAVELLPLDGDAGAGSRISLAAMRLLEVDLTALTELRVYRAN